MATKLDKVYVAGIFDGEGNINLSHNKAWSNNRSGTASPRITMQLTISNTYKPLLRWLTAKFGGRSRPSKAIKRLRPEHKLSYNWTKSEQEAARFARLIRPYLKVKHKQVDLLLELARRKALNPTHKRLTKREVAFRFKLVRECRRLNKRGQCLQS